MFGSLICLCLLAAGSTKGRNRKRGERQSRVASHGSTRSSASHHRGHGRPVSITATPRFLLGRIIFIWNYLNILVRILFIWNYLNILVQILFIWNYLNILPRILLIWNYLNIRE